MSRHFDSLVVAWWFDRKFCDSKCVSGLILSCRREREADKDIWEIYIRLRGAEVCCTNPLSPKDPYGGRGDARDARDAKIHTEQR